MSNKIKYKSTNTGLRRNLTAETRTLQLSYLAKERGDRLKTLRKMSKKSLHEFAKLINIHYGTLGRIERAQTCLSIQNAELISYKCAQIFNIIATVDWLLLGKGEVRNIEDNKINLQEWFRSHLKSHPLNISLFDNDSQDKAQIMEEYQQIAQLDQRQTSKTNNLNELLSNACVFHTFAANPNYLFTLSNDNHMMPEIAKGNIVMGPILSSDKIYEAHDQVCIIKINPDSKLLIRKLEIIYRYSYKTYGRGQKKQEEDQQYCFDNFQESYEHRKFLISTIGNNTNKIFLDKQPYQIATIHLILKNNQYNTQNNIKQSTQEELNKNII